MDRAKEAIRIGCKFPFDESGKPITWQRAAVLGILCDLTDRRGIKHGFNDLDDDIKNEIVDSLTKIVEEAHKARDLGWLSK